MTGPRTTLARTLAVLGQVREGDVKPAVGSTAWLVEESKRLRAENLRLRAAVTDAQRIAIDYSEGRLDPLVALGKIGLRILEVTG